MTFGEDSIGDMPIGAINFPIIDEEPPVAELVSISLVPSEAIIVGGESMQFTAMFNGVGDFSRDVVWETTIGAVSSTGLIVVPAAMLMGQTGVLTVNSTEYPSKTASAQIVIPPMTIETPEGNAYTVAVTVLAVDQQGNRMAGAPITCTLNKVDVDPNYGYVAPEEFSINADENGVAVLNLWPNARGTLGSKYIFIIENPDTGNEMRVDAVIPLIDCILHQVAVPIG